MENKVQLMHPAGKHAIRMDKSKYEVLKKAIIKSLKKDSLTHTELFKAVQSDFKNRKIKFEGSVQWYMESVKLDLEATKQIERILEKPPKWRMASK